MKTESEELLEKAKKLGAKSYTISHIKRGSWHIWGYSFFLDDPSTDISKKKNLREVAHYLKDLDSFVVLERPHSTSLINLNTDRKIEGEMSISPLLGI